MAGPYTMANAAKQQLYNMESGILENQASMRTGKTKKPPTGGGPNEGKTVPFAAYTPTIDTAFVFRYDSMASGPPSVP